MSRSFLAAILVIALAGSAAADRISVSAERTEDAHVVKRELDRWAATEQLDPERRADVGVVVSSAGPDAGGYTVAAELRATVSDGRGEMRSVLASSAKLTVPASEYRRRGLVKLRRDALLAAAEAMQPKLREQLRASPATRVAKR